ncbi:ROK family protein [Funiculus sociatus GB2-A5]|uniref:ROK family protein n=1 Tax=Funiculus sociatus GB2-A5 TaxID=2933946 RepID=A0ABV0JQG2_9CYAN|nr:MULTISPECIES: ROK family protein [unclassified Trichocoleus]MBD1906671.1 ROK family protein [Trichocoleus sp. FACHB-832]MBD1933421.1 ROK family protein [Trichocoleus sp. FACHB-69]MBD2063108.1 ROK family protein [Trichocoleus sp. FACHB-6]
MRTLAVDIGGSGIKAIILDEDGQPLTERSRVDTPNPPVPEVVMDAIATLVSSQGEFDRVSVGFPGVVRSGVTKTAVNLSPNWIGFDLATALCDRLKTPVAVVNDADMQGLGAISGSGVELTITLGTGFGSALFVEGLLVPNLELGHHQFRKGETYEEQLGRAALDKVGEKKWNSRLEKAIASLQNLFNYDYLYIGGGEAKKVTLNLPLNVKIVPNVTGLLGGIALWRD